MRVSRFTGLTSGEIVADARVKTSSVRYHFAIKGNLTAAIMGASDRRTASGREKRTK
jgi:hypothetical protein